MKFIHYIPKYFIFIGNIQCPILEVLPMFILSVLLKTEQVMARDIQTFRHSVLLR